MTFWTSVIALLAVALGLGPSALVHAVGRRFGVAMALIATLEIGLFSIGLLTLAFAGLMQRPPFGASGFSLGYLLAAGIGVVALLWTPMAVASGLFGAWLRWRSARS